MSQLIMPQEVEVFYILPTIRKQLAIYMKKLGYQQKKIATLLNIRESTVSQYISEKRGSTISFPTEIEHELEKSASKITTQSDLIRESQKILMMIRQSGFLCTIHKQVANIDDQCDIKTTRCV